MTYKTKSEVMAELRSDANVISRHTGKCVKVAEAAYHSAYLEIEIEPTEFNYINGIICPYKPDQDTKKDALKKAWEMFVKLLDDGKQPSICNVEDVAMGCYFTVYPCDDGGIFDYKPDHSPTPDQITDEAPPKGIAIKTNSGIQMLSLGYFYSAGCLAARDVSGHACYPKIYKSLTTPHRSKDWED